MVGNDLGCYPSPRRVLIEKQSAHAHRRASLSNVRFVKLDGGKIGTYLSTNWASDYTADEEILGTIEPGKLADFAIIEKGFLSVPEDDFGELNMLMKVAEGKVLYKDNGL